MVSRLLILVLTASGCGVVPTLSLPVKVAGQDAANITAITTSYCERQELANKDANKLTKLVKMAYCNSDTVYDYQLCSAEDPTTCRVTAEWPLESAEREGGVVLGGACQEAVNVPDEDTQEDAYYLLTCMDSVITMTGYSDPWCKNADGAVHTFGGKVWAGQCEEGSEGGRGGDGERGGSVKDKGGQGRRLAARSHHLHAHLHHMRDAKLQEAMMSTHLRDAMAAEDPAKWDLTNE